MARAAASSPAIDAAEQISPARWLVLPTPADLSVELVRIGFRVGDHLGNGLHRQRRIDSRIAWLACAATPATWRKIALETGSRGAGGASCWSPALPEPTHQQRVAIGWSTSFTASAAMFEPAPGRLSTMKLLPELRRQPRRGAGAAQDIGGAAGRKADLGCGGARRIGSPPAPVRRGSGRAAAPAQRWRNVRRSTHGRPSRLRFSTSPRCVARFDCRAFFSRENKKNPAGSVAHLHELPACV